MTCQPAKIPGKIFHAGISGSFVIYFDADREDTR